MLRFSPCLEFGVEDRCPVPSRTPAPRGGDKIADLGADVKTLLLASVILSPAQPDRLEICIERPGGLEVGVVVGLVDDSLRSRVLGAVVVPPAKGSGTSENNCLTQSRFCVEAGRFESALLLLLCDAKPLRTDLGGRGGGTFRYGCLFDTLVRGKKGQMSNSLDNLLSLLRRGGVFRLRRVILRIRCRLH